MRAITDREELQAWASDDPAHWYYATGCEERLCKISQHFAKGYCRFHYYRRMITARRIMSTQAIHYGHRTGFRDE